LRWLTTATILGPMSDADVLLRMLIGAGKVPRAFPGPGGRPVLEVRTHAGYVQFAFGPDGRLLDLEAGAASMMAEDAVGAA
jgi:hypothetical protein